MYANLKKELRTNLVTQGQIAELLGVREATVSDKVNGKSRFSVDEALKIKRVLFPKFDLVYLFEFYQN